MLCFKILSPLTNRRNGCYFAKDVRTLETNVKYFYIQIPEEVSCGREKNNYSGLSSKKKTEPVVGSDTEPDFIPI